MSMFSISCELVSNNLFPERKRNFVFIFTMAVYIGVPGPYDPQSHKWSRTRTQFEHFLLINDILRRFKANIMFNRDDWFNYLRDIGISNISE